MTDEMPWTVTQLLRRVDAGRAWLDEQLARLDEPALDEPVGGGWTRRQMLQHLVVWHELTTERLRAYRSTGQPPQLERDEDDINAGAAQAAQGRSRDELLAHLDTSFGALREEIAALRDEQLTEHDGWPGGVVAGNTFGHYEDHRPDLDRPAASG